MGQAFAPSRQISHALAPAQTCIEASWSVSRCRGLKRHRKLGLTRMQEAGLWGQPSPPIKQLRKHRSLHGGRKEEDSRSDWSAGLRGGSEPGQASFCVRGGRTPSFSTGLKLLENLSAEDLAAGRNSEADRFHAHDKRGELKSQNCSVSGFSGSTSAFVKMDCLIFEVRWIRSFLSRRWRCYFISWISGVFLYLVYSSVRWVAAWCWWFLLWFDTFPCPLGHLLHVRKRKL